MKAKANKKSRQTQENVVGLKNLHCSLRIIHRGRLHKQTLLYMQRHMQTEIHYSFPTIMFHGSDFFSIFCSPQLVSAETFLLSHKQ